ncbi:hypothetical protein C8F01DRAFT_1247138 [Mycena amicta]|nr:hypothetical protein C8F01DRAFT_1247138 [Mycena amicta]
MSEKISEKAELEATDASVHDIPIPTGEQLKPLSRSALRLYAVLLVTFIGSMGWGFDTARESIVKSVISCVNGMAQFTNYFDISGGATGGGQGIITAILYSIFTLGCLGGSLVAGPIADSHRWGRRGAMFIGSLLILAGVSTVTAAQSRTYLFFGRFLIGFGSTINNSASNAYVAEMAPPQWRGRIGGLYNTFSFIGSVVSSSMTIATSRIDSSWSWRLPFAMQLVPTVVLALGVWFVPESPRWLMSMGRKDAAHAVLVKYHGNGDPNAPLVLLEFKELQDHIEIKPQHDYWREFIAYSELFNSRQARYRTLLTCWLGICCVWSGIGIFYYVTVVFDLAGVKTQDGRLVLSSVAIALGALGALIGSLVVDKVGRRPLWLFGAASCSILLALSAAFVAKAMSSVAITFILLFALVQSMVYVPLQGIYPSECLPFASRGKGLALFALVESLGALVNNFAGSVAFAKIGWRYILVPAVFNAVQVLVTWLCAVETRGRTLEELDEIFKDRYPVKAALEKERVF